MYDQLTKGYILARFRELSYAQRCPIVLGYNRYAGKRGYETWSSAMFTLIERHCHTHQESLNDFLNRMERDPSILLEILEQNEFPSMQPTGFKFSLSPDGTGGNS